MVGVVVAAAAAAVVEVAAWQELVAVDTSGGKDTILTRRMLQHCWVVVALIKLQRQQNGRIKPYVPCFLIMSTLLQTLEDDESF